MELDDPHHSRYVKQLVIIIGITAHVYATNIIRLIHITQVMYGDQLIYSKLQTDKFPTHEEILSQVRELHKS